MAKRAYGQFCGLAHGLELVGERWALLIVRDLLVGPRRFTDLRRGLPRIPTNILSARLKELEHASIIRRRILPRPANAVVYELTDYGRDLDEVVYALGRWGARSLTMPRPEDVLTADAMIVALRATFRPESAKGLTATYELHLGPLVVVRVVVDDGVMDAAEGAAEEADLVVVTDALLRDLMAERVDPARAVEDGLLHLTGDARLMDRFVEMFHIDPAPLPASPA